MRDDGGDDVRDGRHVQRRRCLPPLGDDHAVRRRHLRRIHADAGADLRRRGCLPAVTTSLCDPYLCNTATTACRTTCTANTDCVSPNLCVNMSCGKLPRLRPARWRASALEFLRAGRLLRDGLHGHVRVVRAGGTMGTCTSFQRDRIR